MHFKFQIIQQVTVRQDGFRILNDNSGRVTMYNWEDDDIAFGTGNSGGGGC
ncbi:MAG: hypothetical protein IPO63_05030 [Bacteroidetes bacterium]|nr:hypothetical protein [Bacteroidota bacterium]